MNNQQFNPAPQVPSHRISGGRRSTMSNFTKLMALACAIILAFVLTPSTAVAAKKGDCPKCDAMPTSAQVSACDCGGSSPQSQNPQKKRWCEKEKEEVAKWSRRRCDPNWRPGPGKLTCDPEKHEVLSEDGKSCDCAMDFARCGDGEECVSSKCEDPRHRFNPDTCQCEDPCGCFRPVEDKLDAVFGKDKELVTMRDVLNAIGNGMGDLWLLLLLIVIFTGISALRNLFELKDRVVAWNRRRQERKAQRQSAAQPTSGGGPGQQPTSGGGPGDPGNPPA